MNFKRILYTDTGRNIISIVLGIGLATLFQRICKGEHCIHFTGPVLENIDGKIYKYNENCYKYDVVTVSCDPSKKIIETTKK